MITTIDRALDIMKDGVIMKPLTGLSSVNHDAYHPLHDKPLCVLQPSYEGVVYKSKAGNVAFSLTVGKNGGLCLSEGHFFYYVDFVEMQNDLTVQVLMSKNRFVRFRTTLKQQIYVIAY